MGYGEECYSRFLEGDKSAFDEVVKTYFRNLTFFINRYLHNLEDSEDVAIDVLVELVTHPGRYNFKTSLKTYLFVMARSRALNYLKKRKKIFYVNLSDVENYLTTAQTPELSIIEGADKDALYKALAQLPEDMQTVIYLFYYENATYDEIAKVMNKNKKQIDNLLYRAKISLRNYLKGGGEDL